MMPMQKVEVLRAACCVAGVDGEMSEAEQSLVDRLAKQVGVGRASLTAMIERASSDKEFHKEQFKILKEDPQDCLATIFEVALADGNLSSNEQAVLKTLADNLEVPPDIFDQLLAKVDNLK